MAAAARRRVEAAGVEGLGVAIRCDHRRSDGAPPPRARTSGFLDVFVNPSDIGGRYSALTFFGIVPAALMGIAAGTLLAKRASHGGGVPRNDARTNPGPRAWAR